MNIYVLYALIATLGTWLVTALGAATVVFFKSQNQKTLNIMLGFASGVMIAASFWSLLQPAIEKAEKTAGIPAYLVATIGFLSGALFMWVSDKVVTFARKNTQSHTNDTTQRIIMLVLSITLHNIPEGLAVGVAFGVGRICLESTFNRLCSISRFCYLPIIFCSILVHLVIYSNQAEHR